ncbi:MAG: hypothetical protein WED07_08640 [Candidatus Freyarchaeum deiterrae]
MYLAFISGGYVEVLEFNKRTDATSYSGLIRFEYERNRNRYTQAAEKLFEKSGNKDAKRILVVMDDEEKKLAQQKIQNTYPEINIISKSELPNLYPPLYSVILEHIGRRSKEFSLKKRIIISSNKRPIEKVLLLTRNFVDRVSTLFQILIK